MIVCFKNYVKLSLKEKLKFRVILKVFSMKNSIDKKVLFLWVQIIV